MPTEEIANRFKHHPPRDENTVKAHEFVRETLRWVAGKFDEELPAGREKSVAMTKLEEAMFWANAAIARES
ncbi:MAG TPA: hypothetical protein VFX97_20575 [Pyrinomonadaceae bacterium]|nr:hypothetical protein [Pyrinomonadaceae bacterium]